MTHSHGDELMKKTTWATVVASMAHYKKVSEQFGDDDLSPEYFAAIGDTPNFTIKDGKVYEYGIGGTMHEVEIMTHREIHVQLHDSLDKLLADYFSNVENASTQDMILDLMEWSCKQAKEPDHPVIKNCTACENRGFILAKRDDGETCIRRCDTCERFGSDSDAVECAWTLLLRHCYET
jgi:hypothetical protein